MKDSFAGDVSHHLITTALSCCPFPFPEGQRTHESHWVQECQESSMVSLGVTQDPESAAMVHPTPSHQGGHLGLQGCCWGWVTVPALPPLSMGGELYWNWDKVAPELVPTLVLCSCRAYLLFIRGCSLAWSLSFRGVSWAHFHGLLRCYWWRTSSGMKSETWCSLWKESFSVS